MQDASQIVQVMADQEIAEKRDPALRLPRQAEQYSQIVGHFLAVKNSREIAMAIQRISNACKNTTTDCSAYRQTSTVTLARIDPAKATLFPVCVMRYPAGKSQKAGEHR